MTRVLVAHNSYRLPGGEDGVVAAEVRLLREHGHDVETLFRDNRELGSSGLLAGARAARDCVWSADSAQAMRAAIRSFRPDVVHVHNTLAMLSPSIYWAAAECGVPVVQTLHNYRLACPQGMLLREGRVCRDCVGKIPLPGVVHRCYRESRSQTLAVAAMLTVHRSMGTWAHKISRYIALSEFCREQYVAAGLPGHKIRVKPNFSVAPAADRPNEAGQERDLLYVGRMSPEKGISVLARALRSDGSLTCTVVGDGPERASFERDSGTRASGWVSADEVSQYMHRALALVVPSIWFEPFALTTIEAFAHGLPIIGSRIGSLPEIITDGRTGMLFEAGNAADLAQKMRWAQENPEEMRRMGDAARRTHEERYSAGVNYRLLTSVYDDAIGTRAN